MSNTTNFLEPNHYPEDFCCHVATLGTASTGIFKNDRQVLMAVDSIVVLRGAKATVAEGAAAPVVRFRIDSANGSEIQAVTVPTTASTAESEFKLGRILKPGEVLFYQGAAGVDNLKVQIRLRSRVA